MQKKRTNKWDWFYIILISMLVGHVLVISFSGGSLYADGSFSFMKILLDKKFTAYQPERLFSYPLQQFFVLIGVQCGVKSVGVLTFLYTFSEVTAYTIFIILTCIRCKNRGKPFFAAVSAITFVLVIIGSGSFLHGEYLVAFSICWYIFVYFLTYDQEKERFVEQLCMSVIAIFSTRIYQSSLFFALIIILLICYKLWKQEIKFHFFVLYMLFIEVMCILIQGKGILHPTDLANSSGFFRSIIHLDCRLLIVCLIYFAILALQCWVKSDEFFSIPNFLLYLGAILSSAFFILAIPLQIGIRNYWAIGLGILLIFWILNGLFIKVLPSKTLNIIVYSLTVLLVTIITIIVLFHAEKYFAQSYHMRAFALIIPFASMVFLFSLHISDLNVNPKPLAVASLAILGCLLVFSVQYSIMSNRSLKDTVALLNGKTGFVVMTSEMRDAFYWGWTTPLHSIFAQSFYSNSYSLTAIGVEPPEEIGHAPFDSGQIEDYPDLTEYGIYYDLQSFNNG